MLLTPAPILVVDLFPLERRALLALLESLPLDDWSRPTIAGDWTVKDVAAHLVADDLGRVSSGRDEHRQVWVPPDEPLKAYIDRRNAEWVTAMRRLSPRVVRSLRRIRRTGDPATVRVGGSVRSRFARRLGRAAARPALARPRAGAHGALAPSTTDPRGSRRADAQRRDLPATSAGDVRLCAGATVWRCRCGARDSRATLDRGPERRRLDGMFATNPAGVSERGGPHAPNSSITMDEDTAWRMFVRASTRAETEAKSSITGDPRLASYLFEAVALVS